MAQQRILNACVQTAQCRWGNGWPTMDIMVATKAGRGSSRPIPFLPNALVQHADVSPLAKVYACLSSPEQRRWQNLSYMGHDILLYLIMP